MRVCECVCMPNATPATYKPNKTVDSKVFSRSTCARRPASQRDGMQRTHTNRVCFGAAAAALGFVFVRIFFFLLLSNKHLAHKLSHLVSSFLPRNTAPQNDIALAPYRIRHMRTHEVNTNVDFIPTRCCAYSMLFIPSTGQI